MSDQAKKVRGKRQRRQRAKLRIRRRIRGTAERPRLAVYKSLRFISAQLIDDEAGRTLVQAHSAEEGLAGNAAGSASSRGAAKAVGEAIAERAKASGVERVVFDRSGYIYHGKIKDLADGARGKGLVF